MKQLSTDVLVIGSGGAGLRAALEARRQGVRVLIVSKSKAGLANCTAVAMGAFRVSKEEGIETHFQETLEAGRFLNNPELVRTLVMGAWSAVKEMEEFGLTLAVERDKVSIVSEKKPAGVLLTRALKNVVLGVGATMLEDAAVFHLLVEENRCVGALAIRRDTGEFLAISARATVVAAGGYSQLYTCSDNPTGITGDGLILAYEAGAALQDLEFVQFEPMFTDEGVPRMPILDWLIEATKNLIPGGPLMNGRGERFLDSYGLLKQRILRDNLIVAIEREILEGKQYRDSIVLDLTSLSPEKIEGALSFAFQKAAVRPFLDILSARPLHIGSSAHYSVGGIRINSACETAVKGLYAVGEVCGGIHGANRLGGNALTEILVFGAICGRHAAQYAKKTEQSILSREQARMGKERLREIQRTKEKSIDPSVVKNDVKSIISQFCSPVRSGEGLAFALEALQRTREEKVSFLTAGSPQQCVEALEARFMMELALLMTTAAFTRSESRGSHFRVDYPGRDENWLKNIVIQQKDGRTQIQIMSV